MKDFNVEHYNENTPLLKSCLKDKNIKELNGKICKDCDSKLQQHTIVTCANCEKTMKWYTALVHDNEMKTYKCKPCNSTLQQQQQKCIACGTNFPYHRTIKFSVNKYNMNDDTVRIALNFPLDTICIECHHKLTATNTCTCCHSKLHIYKVIQFNPDNYVFTNYIMSQALSSQNGIIHSSQEYVCKTCHNNLITNENHLPCMP